jgi:RimJ/RimL family protein N-acetyltransferase
MSASLWVLAGNDRALRFYESLGFRPDGVVRDEVLGGQPVTELRLLRSLPY